MNRRLFLEDSSLIARVGIRSLRVVAHGEPKRPKFAGNGGEVLARGYREFAAFYREAEFSERAQLSALILLRSTMRSLAAPGRPISFWEDWHDLRYDCLQLCAAIGESPAFFRLSGEEKAWMRQRLLNPDAW